MKTKRILIQPLSLDDCDDVFRLTSNPNVSKYMRFSMHTQKEEAIALIESYTKPEHCHAFCVREINSNAFIGIFVLKGDENKQDEYDMTTFSGEEYWGKGYATEVLAQMIAYAKEQLHASCLRAYVVGDNKASCCVLEKNGFTIEKVIPIHLPCGLNVFKLDIR